MFAKITMLLGLGIIEEIGNNRAVLKNNPIAFEYRQMFGKSKEPVDYYLCGIVEEVYKAFLGKEVIVKEVKCIACDDSCCEFRVFF